MINNYKIHIEIQMILICGVSTKKGGIVTKELAWEVVTYEVMITYVIMEE